MDLKRVTSALLGFPIVVLVILLGNKYVIDVVMAIIAIIALYEYFNAFKDKYNPIKWVGYVYASAISIIHILPIENIFIYIAFSIPFVIVLLFIELIIKDMKINIIDIMITLFGIFYIVLFIMFIPIITASENGKIIIWYAIIAAWGTDIFAYVIGKTLKMGKHKFSKISPNKSIEGCIAGVIGAVVLTLIYTIIINIYFKLNISYIYITLVAILLSIIGQFGDFSASSIKRYTGIKDFSNLIPGHGGVMDRIDSLIFIAPFVYMLFYLI